VLEQPFDGQLTVGCLSYDFLCRSGKKEPLGEGDSPLVSGGVGSLRCWSSWTELECDRPVFFLGLNGYPGNKPRMTSRGAEKDDTT
jgi:hypothetical protein